LMVLQSKIEGLLDRELGHAAAWLVSAESGHREEPADRSRDQARSMLHNLLECYIARALNVAVSLVNYCGF